MLLVVPLSADETDQLALAEWDALTARRRVSFERADHPLEKRLTAAGVTVVPLDPDVAATDATTAVVTEPGSALGLRLAREGALVTAGAAPSVDGLTASVAAPQVRRAAAALGEVVAVMARLRSDDGCPWDAEQTHASLGVHLLEEAHEVVDAIDRGLLNEDLEEELGDVLLQVVFHAQLAFDDGRFGVDSVARRLVAKLVRRHPHVFGDTAVAGAAEVVANWEQIKRNEKGRDDPFDDIPGSLPALLAAAKTLKRGRGIGVDIDEATARVEMAALVAGGIPGEAVGSDEADLAATWVGRVLLLAVAVARARGVEPEQALRRETHRFRDSVGSR